MTLPQLPFYQAYECFYVCCAYLGTTVVRVTNVITDFLVTVIVLVTEFTCFLSLPLLLCTQRLSVFVGCCECTNFRSADIFCLVLKFALCLCPLMLLGPILRRRQCVILERDLIG